jgi:Glu-tRNA(Gln) amidotransferase subunit E-like FAD-binding protein
MSDAEIKPEMVTEALKKASRDQLIDALFAEYVLDDALAEWMGNHPHFNAVEERCEEEVIGLLQAHNWGNCVEALEERAKEEALNKKEYDQMVNEIRSTY